MKKIIFGAFIICLYNCTQPQVQEDVTFRFASEKTIWDIDIIGKDTFFLNEYYYGVIRNYQYDTLLLNISHLGTSVNKAMIPSQTGQYIGDSWSSIDIMDNGKGYYPSEIILSKHQETKLLFLMPELSDWRKNMAYDYYFQYKDSTQYRDLYIRIGFKNGINNDPVKVEILE